MQFDLRAAPSLPHVLGDRDLLVQMLANLIENALRHCPPGTLIIAEADATASGIRLVVRDTGPGIPPGEREKVFRRLYRLEKSRTTPGSGLGMSLVKAIVELHGGTVALADNHPGLAVLVDLPVLPKT